MKTLSFKNLLKYALLTVTLLTAFLAAIFIFSVKNERCATAAEISNVATGDFTQNNVGSFVNNNELNFSSIVDVRKTSELHNLITSGRTDLDGDATFNTTYEEYYVITVITEDLTSFYNCLNYNCSAENTYAGTFTPISIYDNLFTANNVSADSFIIATPTLNSLASANTYKTEKYYMLDTFTSSDISFNFSNVNTTKYVYSFVIKYWYNVMDSFNINTPSTYFEKINVIAKTDNYVTFNPNETVKSRLLNATYKNDNLLIACQKYLGIYTGETANVNVNYIKMKDFSLYETANVSFNIDSIYATSPKVIETELFNVLASQGFDDITDFNAKYVDYEYVADGNQNMLSEKIIRHATALDVKTDFTQVDDVNVEVVYSDFKYGDLALYVTNNGYNIDTELLKMPVYTTNVEYNSDLDLYRITYNFALIEQQLKNTLNWLFDLDSSNIFVVGSNNNVNVTINDDALIISFNVENESNLFGLSLQANAEIIEDYDLTYKFNYIELNNDLEETLITSAPYTIKYSDFVKLCNANNFYTKHGDVIDAAISPEVLNGAKFYAYNDITVTSDKEKATSEINVEYAYTTTFKLISSAGEIYYVPLNKNSLNYTFGELNFVVPDGHRVSNVSRTSNDVNIVFNERDPSKAKITVNVTTNLKRLITLNIDVTDKWFVSINYLQRYKDTPFAELINTEKEVKVADFERSVYEWTKDDVASVLGVSTLEVLSSAPDLIKVTFDKISTYTIDVTYSKASITQIDYDGNRCEIQVPLTSFADWTEFYGKDWSILFLNNQDERYFKYANEIPRDTLYGYFAVAVFKEQVKDFNYYFKNNTGDGCMAFYNSTEVVGSDLYKFFGGIRDSVLGISAHVGMALCEVVNDSNAIYHSYFFFLNSDSDLPFISNGGADNAFDDDGAFGNAVQDANDALINFGAMFGDFFSGMGDFFSTLGTILIVVIIAGAIVVVVYLIKK